MLKQSLFIAGATMLALLNTGCGGDSSADDDIKATPSILTNQQSSYFSDGQSQVGAAQAMEKNLARARNVILFVGDGMGVSTVTAARIFAGQRKGLAGEEHALHFEHFPYLALAKTYNTNQQTPDSAGTMTAMMSGAKTKAGVISQSDDVARAQLDACDNTSNLSSFLEIAESLGMATGIVSTARITHATPAATYAHVPERNWEYATPEGSNCKDIARQLIEFPYGNGLEVALGGGRRAFFPEDGEAVEGKSGRRTDGRDLREEWKTRFGSHAAVVQTSNELAGVDYASVSHLLGLFEDSHMEYEADRADDAGGEPSLSEMTESAIRVLEDDSDGFFLMVEAGRIDHAHHAGNAYRAMTDTVEFANAVKKADELTSDEDTLIIVTADHSHVFTIGGYPTRGNPILGHVVGNDSSGASTGTPALALDDLPYTTLTYANGRGHATDTEGDDIYDLSDAEVLENIGRQDTSTDDPEDSGYHQEALVPLGSETHAGEDVAIYAKGPGAHLMHGVQEQSYIFHVMSVAADLLGRAGL